MNITDKQERQQILFNCLSDIVFKDVFNLYKTIFVFSYWCYSFASDNLSRFRKNHLEKYKYKKLRNDINRQAAKIALPSRIIDKHDYFTGEEILPSN